MKTSAPVRPLSAIPRLIVGMLVIALGMQLLVATMRAEAVVAEHALPAPPSLGVLRVLALGEPEVLARVMMLWLQAFDNQPGLSIALADLDYRRVEHWLDRALDLDPAMHYPLLVASRLYAQTGTHAERRRMLAFVARRFDENPLARWQWLAHAVLIARHQLHDNALALAYAEQLAAAPASLAIPDWARQMRIFVLEDMGELDAAKVLLGGLLDSGQISDPNERRFLSARLLALEQRVAADQAGAAAASVAPTE